MKYCKTCLFPNTKPDLTFNKFGICDACLSVNEKINLSEDYYKEREIFLKEIFKKHKNKKSVYDCVVPVSGGKDSTYQLYVVKNIFNLKPLCVTFDQFDQTETGLSNIKSMQNIGTDHIHFTLNPIVLKKLIRKGLETVGDPYWVNHVGMFTIPFRIANQFKIPLVVYGENPQYEYGGPNFSKKNYIMDKRWRQEFGGMRGLREEDMIDENLSSKDLQILEFPNEQELKKNNILGIFLGQFIKWDVQKQLKIIKKFGWKELKRAPRGSWLKYENCDMEFIDIREYIKYLKFGYGRANDQLSIALRHKLIDRKKAIKILEKTDGKFSKSNLKKFCKLINISEREFNNIIDSFVNKNLFYRNNKNQWILKKGNLTK